MAVGRKTDSKSPPVALSGNYGRLEVPPEGGMYVRDPAVAEALAIQNKIKLYKLLGQEVPEHLAALAEGLPEVTDGDAVILVDSTTGELIVDVDVVDHDAGEDLPPGASRAWQTSPDPVESAPEPAPAPVPVPPEPEPTPEPEPEPEPPPVSQTVAEKRAPRKKA